MSEKVRPDGARMRVFVTKLGRWGAGITAFLAAICGAYIVWLPDLFALKYSQTGPRFVDLVPAPYMAAELILMLLNFPALIASDAVATKAASWWGLDNRQHLYVLIAAFGLSSLIQWVVFDRIVACALPRLRKIWVAIGGEVH